jgi:hypothetical protein
MCDDVQIFLELRLYLDHDRFDFSASSTVKESCMLPLRCILQAGCYGSFRGLDHVLQAPRGQVDQTISGAEKPCRRKAFGLSFLLLCNCSACTVVLAQVDVRQSPTSEKRRPQWSGHG